MPCGSAATASASAVSKVATIGNERGFVAPIHRAGVRHLAEHHVRIGGEVFVDLKLDAVTIDVLSEIQPCRSARLFAIVQLPQEDDVGRNFGVRVSFERGVRQPDCAEKIDLVREVSAQAGVDLIERALRGDEGQQPAGSNFLDALREEVVVNEKIALVELRIVQLVVAERDV